MTNPHKKTHLIILVLAVCALGAGAFYYSTASDAVPGIPEERYQAIAPASSPPTPPPASKPEPASDTRGEFDFQFAKTEDVCVDGGGQWNPCASACPDAGPDELCIQVCVERCEPKEAF